MIPLLLGCAPPELVVDFLALGSEAAGEALVVTGPEGRKVLVDTGNDRHSHPVHLAAEGADFLLVSDWRPAHAGGGDDLLVHGPDRLEGARLVTRGLGGTSSDVDRAELEDICPVAERFDLCEAPEACPPTSDAEAEACPGLDAGELEVAGDAGPPWIDLGGGAGLAILYADGWLPGGPLATPPANEAGRRMVIVVRFEGFELVMGGAGADAELVAGLDEGWLPPEGADLMVFPENGRGSDLTDAWVERVAAPVSVVTGAESMPGLPEADAVQRAGGEVLVAEGEGLRLRVRSSDDWGFEP